MSHISPELVQVLHEERLAEADRHRKLRQLPTEQTVGHPLSRVLRRVFCRPSGRRTASTAPARALGQRASG